MEEMEEMEEVVAMEEGKNNLLQTFLIFLN
jgi:hypothetical protein